MTLETRVRPRSPLPFQRESMRSTVSPTTGSADEEDELARGWAVQEDKCGKPETSVKRTVHFGADRARAVLASPTESEASSTTLGADDVQWAVLIPPGQQGGSRLRRAARTGNRAHRAIEAPPPPCLVNSCAKSKLARSILVNADLKVRELIAAGASVHSYCEVFERTALHYAAHNGQVRLPSFPSHIPTPAPSHACSHPPHACSLPRPPGLRVRFASSGQVTCVRMLQELGADVEAVDRHYETAVHLAAERGHAAVLEALIDEGAASVWRRSANGALPLHTAAAHNHAEAVAVLLEAMRRAPHGGRSSGGASFVGGAGAVRRPFVKRARASSAPLGEALAPSHAAFRPGVGTPTAATTEERPVASRASSATGAAKGVPDLCAGVSALEMGVAPRSGVARRVLVTVDTARGGTSWAVTPAQVARAKGWHQLAEIVDASISVRDVAIDRESDDDEGDGDLTSLL